MFKIKDEYRKNDLSLEPGGSEVYVVYPGETRVYDKVKYPQAFANGIINKCKMMGNTKKLLLYLRKELTQSL